MSHFTVLVIGPDPEQQLEKYDENISVPSYHKEKVSDEEKNSMVEYYVKEKGFKYVNNFDELYAKYGRDWNGRSWRQHTDGSWHKYSTYNPDSKWDWYQLGGRWTGFFKLKKGLVGKIGDHSLVSERRADVGTSDQCRKGDVDIERMRNDAAKAAAKEYDKAMLIVEGTEEHETWKQMMHRLDNNVEQVRVLYHDQPRVKAWMKNDKVREDFGIFSSPDDYLLSREEYIENARQSAISTFAVVKDGKWYEKGEMGWFGMARNEMDEKDWNRAFNNWLDELPDDTLLSVFDCHI